MKNIVVSNYEDVFTKKKNLEKEYFGELANGEKVFLFNMNNSSGMKVSISNYGGIITKIIVPDKYGNMGDVVLGFDNLEGYIKNNLYFGAIIGRYANRISKGKFNIKDIRYSLPINNGINHLHGGVKGFDKVIWDVTEINGSDQVGLSLSYKSPDGEEGYPGTMNIIVSYILTDQNELCIEYKATTDKQTICNLTNHSYFNLRDSGKSSILNHKLQIYSDKITPIDNSMIPTGELMHVKETPFDFRKGAVIGQSIHEKHEQLEFEPGGFDHNFVLNGKYGEMHKAAVLSDNSSGRQLDVFTKEPGMQLYTGNYLDGTISGKGGIIYKKFSGLCLETQHFPDSPNKHNFPSTILDTGETYNSITIFKFSVIE